MLGVALKNRGWTVEGLKSTESDPMTDYYSPGWWRGRATNAKYVGTEIFCGTTEVRKTNMWAVYRHGRYIGGGKGFYISVGSSAKQKENLAKVLGEIVQLAEKEFTVRPQPQIKSPDEPASARQKWYLHVLTGENTKDWVLTKAQASEQIQKLARGGK